MYFSISASRLFQATCQHFSFACAEGLADKPTGGGAAVLKC
jgi:hypothetical protein